MMYFYPEERMTDEINRKLGKLRWVIYRCGCKLDNLCIVPYKCSIHDELISCIGPMYVPAGDPAFVDPRFTC